MKMSSSILFSQSLDLSTNQSGTDDDEEITDNLSTSPSNIHIDYSMPHVEFDNGSNDRKLN